MNPDPTIAAVAATNRLTAAWARQVAADAGPGPIDGDGFALSGVGVWIILALLASAADGRARDELTAAVGLDAGDAADAAVALVADVDAMAAVRNALGVWLAADVVPTRWWRSTVPAEVWGHLHDDPAEDQPRLDEWVREHTDGLIERLPIELRRDVRLLIVHALTVDATWRAPFVDTMIRGVGPWADRWFSALSRRSAAWEDLVVVDTASGPLTMLAVESDGDVVVHLAMAADDMPAVEVIDRAMTALAGGHPRRTGVELADPQGLGGGDAAIGPGLVWRDSIVAQLVQVVPRFTVSTKHDLLARADLFGLAASKDDSQGHFPGISESPLAISDAGQDITASFTEHGFQAAALTVLAAQAGAMIPTFQARSLVVSFDRPFAFIATSKATGLHLVVGWVAAPDEPARS